MTISVVIEKGVDLSWPLLEGIETDGQPLCTLTFSAHTKQGRNLDEAARSAADGFMRVIGEGTKSQFQLALLLADPTMQNKSAVALRRNFWTSIQEEMMLPSFASTLDAAVICDRNSTFRRAGIAFLDRAELVEAAPVLRKTRTAALLVRTIAHKSSSLLIHELSSAAFGPNCDSVQVNWTEFIPSCLKRGLIPGRLHGEFDDQVAGVDLFGELEVLRRLKERSGEIA
jgi:hypothetical protein